MQTSRVSEESTLNCTNSNRMHHDQRNKIIEIVNICCLRWLWCLSYLRYRPYTKTSYKHLWEAIIRSGHSNAASLTFKSHSLALFVVGILLSTWKQRIHIFQWCTLWFAGSVAFTVNSALVDVLHDNIKSSLHRSCLMQRQISAKYPQLHCYLRGLGKVQETLACPHHLASLA